MSIIQPNSRGNGSVVNRYLPIHPTLAQRFQLFLRSLVENHKFLLVWELRQPNLVATGYLPNQPLFGNGCTYMGGSASAITRGFSVASQTELRGTGSLITDSLCYLSAILPISSIWEPYRCST